MTEVLPKKADYVSATNPCRQCMPLGASWSFKGIKNCMTILHGSQGCATYIRRYMISHFREPIDIASSSFDESTVIFGGERNLEDAIINVYGQYKPEVLAVATTCLSETIGDDILQFIARLEKKYPDLCPIIPVSTPSYQGTQEEGFYLSTLAAVKALAGKDLKQKDSSVKKSQLNLFSPLLSPADIRWLKDLFSEMGIGATILPDYSDTLDGGMWEEYNPIPQGGTSIQQIALMDRSESSIELGASYKEEWRPGEWLQKHFGVPSRRTALPIGIEATDRFLKKLCTSTGAKVPESRQKERGRLIDAYADCHKYCYGKKVVIFGDSSTVDGLYRFACEIGLDVQLCFTGSAAGSLIPSITQHIDRSFGNTLIKEDCDFGDVEDLIEKLNPDLMIGNSKGSKIARKFEIPLIRFGFPIHDRFGASRQRGLGYSGTMILLDRIINTLIEEKQEKSGLGYSYI